MKVSLISGVYNCEKYLAKCLDSLVGQTYEDIEIILINNFCHDNSQKIIEQYKTKYPNKILAYETKEKLGAGGSRKKGFELASGDYIAFIDCDDRISCNYIEEFIKVVKEENYPDIVIGNFCKEDVQQNILYERKFYDKDKALVQSIAPWGKIYRRKFLEENDLCFENIPFGEDILFAAGVYLAHPKVTLCNNIGYYWFNNLNSTSHTEIRYFPKNNIEISKKYLLNLKNKFPESNVDYFAYKYYIWYLLHSGRLVGNKRMYEEYEKVFDILEKEFPLYMTHKNIPEERFILKLVLYFMRKFRKIKLDKYFLGVYSELEVDKLWPKL